MLFVRRLNVLALLVHRVDIVLVLFAEIIHPLDQVISLVGQVCQLLIQSNLVLAVCNFCVPQLLKLAIQIPQSIVSLLMVYLQAFQVVSLPEQIRVY